MNTAGQRRLVNLHKAHGVHNQVSQVVTGIAAGALLAANGQVDKRLITGEVFRPQLARHPHQLGAFDNKRLQQLQRSFVSQAAFANIGFKHRVAVLVHAAQRQAGLVLFNFKQRLHGPDTLQRFLQSLRRVRRDVLVHFGNGQQLGATLGVLLNSGQLTGARGDAMRIVNHPFAGFNRRLVVVDAVDIFRVFHAQAGKMRLRVGFNAVHPFGEQQHVIARAGIAAAVDLMVGEVADEGFAAERPHARFAVLGFTDLIQRAAFPERDDLFADGFLIFFADLKRILRTGAHGIEFVAHPAPGDIRREGPGARLAARMADDQLIVLNQNRRGFAGVTESFGAQQNGRHTRICFHHLGKGQRAIDRDARAYRQVVVAQALHARSQPFCCCRFATGGKRRGGDLLFAVEQTHRQIERAQIPLCAEEQRGKFVDDCAGVIEAGAVAQGVEHRVAVDSAGGADFAQLRQFEPQALNDFIGPLRRQGAVGDVALIPRQQSLIGTFRVYRIAAVVQLQRQLKQIKCLAGLFEVTCRVGRNVMQNRRALQQLGLAIRVAFRRRERFGAGGQILRQGEEGVAGVNGGPAAVDFIHTAAADGATQAAGFLFQLVFNRQRAFFNNQPVIRGVQVAAEIQETERRRTLRGAFIVENRPVRFAGLIADNKLIGADAQRQLAHQLIETARRLDGGGNARDIAIKGVQRGGMLGAQGAFM